MSLQYCQICCVYVTYRLSGLVSSLGPATLAGSVFVHCLVQWGMTFKWRPNVGHNHESQWFVKIQGQLKAKHTQKKNKPNKPNQVSLHLSLEGSLSSHKIFVFKQLQINQKSNYRGDSWLHSTSQTNYLDCPPCLSHLFSHAFAVL